MPNIIRHAFLTPGHNCWSMWTAEGCTNITNTGAATHRVLETLTFAIDQMANEGWSVENIFVDAGSPTLVLLAREESRTE